MLRLLDRLMIYNYLKAYLICLVSLLGLFIVIDLFMNLDDFMQSQRSLKQIIIHISSYYGYKSTQIFDRLSEAIVLLAGMFTVALTQRNNELLPLLSAGVSTRRAVQPVLLSACLMLGMTVLNQELALPNIDSFLVENRNNPEGDKEIDVKGARERNGIFVIGETAYKKDLSVKKFTCTIPPGLGGRDSITPLQAPEAFYVPPGSYHPAAGRHSGGWLLKDAQPAKLDNWTRDDILEWLGPGRYFLHTTDVDFQAATRPKNWFMFMPTLRLYEAINRPGEGQPTGLAVIFHMRLTRPLLGLILVLLGVSVILRDQNRNIFISAGLCLVLCGVFFAAIFTCQFLGNNEMIAPAFAAWLPVLLFGPLSLVMFDAVHT